MKEKHVVSYDWWSIKWNTKKEIEDNHSPSPLYLFFIFWNGYLILCQGLHSSSRFSSLPFLINNSTTLLLIFIYLFSGPGPCKYTGQSMVKLSQLSLWESNSENYWVLRKYVKCVLLSLTEVVDLIMNLISRTHNFCERREYTFKVLPEYLIITYQILT